MISGVVIPCAVCVSALPVPCIYTVILHAANKHKLMNMCRSPNHKRLPTLSTDYDLINALIKRNTLMHTIAFMAFLKRESDETYRRLDYNIYLLHDKVITDVVVSWIHLPKTCRSCIRLMGWSEVMDLSKGYLHLPMPESHHRQASLKHCIKGHTYMTVQT